MADLGCLGAVVLDSDLAEPGVLEGFLCRDALGGVVDEDALEQIQKLPQETARRGNDVLVWLVEILLC